MRHNEKSREHLITVCLVLLLVCLTASCEKEMKPRVEQPIHVQFTIPDLHNGDAKFLGEKIITGISGNLSLIDMDGKIERTYGTNASWIDAVDAERVIVYGNFNHEIGILTLDEEWNVISDKIVMRTDHLQIDPTITRIDDLYYMTATEIDGTVNNEKRGTRNGLYTIHVYTSENLTDWTLLSDISSQRNNLEDIDLIVHGDMLLAVYEEETVDKGNSSIVLKQSSDQGRTWSEPIVLLESDSDHEPVGLYREENRWVLYYSSDLAAPGESYMGGKAYKAFYDDNFICTQKDILIKTETETGILWYDYTVREDTEYYLFAKDYMTTCDLVLECREQS